MEADRELGPEERDIRRAEITRLRLHSLTGPTNVSTDSSEPPAPSHGETFQEPNDE
jgi:hypothetical protein